MKDTGRPRLTGRWDDTVAEGRRAKRDDEIMRRKSQQHCPSAAGEKGGIHPGYSNPVSGITE